RHDEGATAFAPPWPGSQTLEPEETRPEPYRVADTPVCFQATSGPGPLGCDVAALPSGRSKWLQLTYDPFSLPLLDDVPGAEDVSAGESLALTKKVELGRSVQALLDRAKPGDKVVVQVSGEGEHPPSPIHAKGVDLVLAFKQPADGKAKPLTLVVNPTTAADREALIDVEDGNLV